MKKGRKILWLMGIFVFFQLLFSIVFFVNGDKKGLGIVLLVYLLFGFIFIVKELRQKKATRVNKYSSVAVAMNIIFFFSSVFAIQTYLKGSEYGWIAIFVSSAFAAVIFGFISWRFIIHRTLKSVS